MNVVACSPHSWYLLEEAGDLDLDVNCNHSAVGFSILLRLTPVEAAAVRSGGHDAVDRLATTLQDQALAISRSRHLPPEWQARALAAIGQWQSRQPE